MKPGVLRISFSLQMFYFSFTGRNCTWTLPISSTGIRSILWVCREDGEVSTVNGKILTTVSNAAVNSKH